jgi:hypothetical protein
MRHVDVADHEVERPFLKDFPGFLSIASLQDFTLDSQKLKHLVEHAADGRHIIHHQDV